MTEDRLARKVLRMEEVDETVTPALSRCLDEKNEGTCKTKDDDNVMENSEALEV